MSKPATQTRSVVAKRTSKIPAKELPADFHGQSRETPQ